MKCNRALYGGSAACAIEARYLLVHQNPGGHGHEHRYPNQLSFVYYILILQSADRVASCCPQRVLHEHGHKSQHSAIWWSATWVLFHIFSQSHPLTIDVNQLQTIDAELHWQDQTMITRHCAYETGCAHVRSNDSRRMKLQNILW